MILVASWPLEIYTHCKYCFPSAINHQKYSEFTSWNKTNLAFHNWKGPFHHAKLLQSNRSTHGVPTDRGLRWMKSLELRSITYRSLKNPLNQWKFQDPKMEVLYHIRLYFGGISPYIGLVYGGYLQFRFLKWTLIEKSLQGGAAPVLT